MALKSAVLAAGPGGPRHTAEMALLTFLLVASRPTRPTNLNGSLEICGFNICIICCSDYMYIIYIYTCLGHHVSRAALAKAALLLPDSTSCVDLGDEVAAAKTRSWST